MNNSNELNNLKSGLWLECLITRTRKGNGYRENRNNTIHNLRFQGIYNIDTIKYWSNLPDYVFNKDVMTQNWLDANMLKGAIT